MDGEEGKNEVGRKTRVEDLERVVKMRKYQHCEAVFAAREGTEHDAGGAQSIS